MNRTAGILLSVSSLPSKYGIGCFSKSAYEFADWLKEAGQSYWQILPLGPTSYGDSPYQSVYQRILSESRLAHTLGHNRRQTYRNDRGVPKTHGGRAEPWRV